MTSFRERSIATKFRANYIYSSRIIYAPRSKIQKRPAVSRRVLEKGCFIELSQVKVLPKKL